MSAELKLGVGVGIRTKISVNAVAPEARAVQFHPPLHAYCSQRQQPLHVQEIEDTVEERILYVYAHQFAIEQNRNHNMNE